MTRYAEEHSGALADVSAAGAPVSFTALVRTRDPITGETSDVASTVSGFAIQVKGDPDAYSRLSLIESTSPTLFFVPQSYGDRPALGSIVTWAGRVHTARDVSPLAPDGTPIAHRVVISV